MLGNEIAEEIISREPRLSSMKLQKLMYYVDAWHLAVEGERLITDQPFRAYKDGPVHEDVRHKRMDMATRMHGTSTGKLTPAAESILNLVMAEFGGRTGDELSALTHAEVPWKNARGDKADGETSREPLNEAEIARFYRSSRRLGNRTAADLAAGGIYGVFSQADQTELDIDAILGSLPKSIDFENEPAFNGNLVDSGNLGSASRYAQKSE
ncbi:type II toxin-antitoxin system antitoxin SocA domain-containing protein [uncultured Salinibacterium sp.]|uniref:Panacea domain-containing protein n=1 Tax=uncultured Salinibacterium sp. TaxID=459274 RepID=UPI0030D984D5